MRVTRWTHTNTDTSICMFPSVYRQETEIVVQSRQEQVEIDAQIDRQMDTWVKNINTHNFDVLGYNYSTVRPMYMEPLLDIKMYLV